METSAPRLLGTPAFMANELDNPGLASPSSVQLRQADQKTAQVADETCGPLRRRGAQVVQEGIHGFAVGSTDGPGERECIVDSR
jgi:hypothetical protein